MGWELVIGAVGVVVAIIFGVIGIIAGKRGQRSAQDAQDQIGRLERRVSGIGVDISELRDVSIDARKLAEEANSARQRQLDALTEEHVVTWQHDWEGRGTYAFEHTGRHDALRVRAIVTVDGETQIVERERIRPGERITLEYSKARLEEQAADRERRRETEDARFYGLGPASIPHMVATTFEVHWRSAAGVQHSYGPKDATEAS